MNDLQKEFNSRPNNGDDQVHLSDSITPPVAAPVLAIRGLFGGTLMGLANLVPGISGGTMLLVAGVYPAFIEALAELTRFRFRFRSLLLLGCIAAAAGIGILLFAGSLKELVLGYRWIMYSLFIGLTLGGLPIVWRMARPVTSGTWIAAVISFLLMVALAVLQTYGVVGNSNSNGLMFFFGGLAGASAMILPGVSGGYLLLLLGQYVPILSAVDQFKDALKSRDLAAALEPALSVLLPVGIGVIVGIVLVGNLLKWLLHRLEKATLGVLIGLLLGSVCGLFPFQIGREPIVGDWVKGQPLTASTLADVDPEDWPIERFTPSAIQVVSALGLIALGFGVTQGIASIGAEKESGK